MSRANSLEKTLMLGKIEGSRRRGVTEDEMIGWHHWFNWHEFEQTLGDTEGKGSLECCSPWGCKELDKTLWLNNNNGLLQGSLPPTAWLLKSLCSKPCPPIGWRKKLTHLLNGLPSRRYLQELNDLFTLFPHLPPSLIHKITWHPIPDKIVVLRH